MLLAHAVLLAEARSYVAALVDGATGFDAAMDYERVLLQLDVIHGGSAPPVTEVPTGDRQVLLASAQRAIEGLAAHAVDELELEICLAMLEAAYELDTRS